MFPACRQKKMLMWLVQMKMKIQVQMALISRWDCLQYFIWSLSIFTFIYLQLSNPYVQYFNSPVQWRVSLHFFKKWLGLQEAALGMSVNWPYVKPNISLYLLCSWSSMPSEPNGCLSWIPIRERRAWSKARPGHPISGWPKKLPTSERYAELLCITRKAVAFIC